jgi:hypothetical protein
MCWARVSGLSSSIHWIGTTPHNWWPACNHGSTWQQLNRDAETLQSPCSFWDPDQTRCTPLQASWQPGQTSPPPSALPLSLSHRQTTCCQHPVGYSHTEMRLRPSSDITFPGDCPPLTDVAACAMSATGRAPQCVHLSATAQHQTTRPGTWTAAECLTTGHTKKSPLGDARCAPVRVTHQLSLAKRPAKQLSVSQ